MRRVTFDLVTEDPTHGESVVYLVDDGPWPEDDASWDSKLREIQEWLYCAVDAVIDGHLAARFPALRGKPVRIQVDSPSGCPVRLQAFVRAFRDALAAPGEYRDAIAGPRSSTGCESLPDTRSADFR